MSNTPVMKGDIGDIVNELINKNPQVHYVLIHGCNCFNTMGSGLAARIAKLYPEAKKVDEVTAPADRSKLGTISHVTINQNLSIANVYTQYHYGRDPNTVYLNYDALRNGLKMVTYTFPEELDGGVCILYPEEIGCGLAGGDINEVTEIIDDVLHNRTRIAFKR